MKLSLKNIHVVTFSRFEGNQQNFYLENFKIYSNLNPPSKAISITINMYSKAMDMERKYYI